MRRDLIDDWLYRCAIGDECLGASGMCGDGFTVEARAAGAFGLISKACGRWPCYWLL